MSGLRVEKLALANVGVLQGFIDLGEFAPGITLITGENETGKTTTVEALRSALFERHDARHAGIRALKPHHTRLGPEVWVEFSVGGHDYRLHKRFLEQPIAELEIDGVESFTGEEADERVRACLGSSRPGKRGASREDMGLWGLLWVSQDEAAFVDPGRQLGEETRGALQEAIGRLVGQLVGGRHGERLRRRVQEEAARYWTAKTGAPTGELAAATAERTRSAARVAAIEQAVLEVEEQADRHRMLQARLAELLRQRPALEGELVRAARDARSATEARGAAATADRNLAAARARHESAHGRLKARSDLVSRERDLRDRVARATAALEELKRTLATRTAAASAATAASALSRSALDEALGAADTARQALAAALRAAEARDINQRLRRARAASERRSRLLEARPGVLGDDAYQALVELERSRREHASRLEATGTRLILEGLAAPWQAAFGRARDLEIPGLGTVGVAPGGAGLAGARDRLRDVASTLAEALRGLALESLEEARQRRQDRVALEVQRDEREADLVRRAPDGLEPLGQAVAEARAVLSRDERTLVAAARLAGKIAELGDELAAIGVDETVLDRLNSLHQKVEVARARQEAIGTNLALRALADVDVRVDDGAPEHLDPDAARSWTVTRTMRLRIGESAELTIGPRGEEVLEADARLADARAELAVALGEAGVDSLAEARDRGRRWQETRAARVDAEAELRKHAPDGQEALLGRVERQRTELDRLAEQLAAARRAAERRDQISELLAANPVTGEALDRLEQLGEAERQARSEVERLAARVRFEGTAEQVVAERATGTIGDGLSWELIPGEGGAAADAALARVAEELAGALAEAEVADLDEAARRWRQGLELGHELAGVEQELAALAPEGLDVLEAAARGLPDADGVTGDVNELGRSLEAAERAVEAARKEAETVAAAAQRAENERSSLASEIRATELALVDVERDWQDRRSELEAERRDVADDALEVEIERTARDLETATEAALLAEEAMSSTTPELLEGEHERALAAVEESRRQEEKLGRELAGVGALLDRAAAEGNFEELGDRLAELGAAEERLAHVERNAAAARRLAEEVENAYRAAQARFLAPVVREAKPYLAAIRPGTDIRMTPDLGVDKVVRRGAEESFESLSGGTREQLSVIVRLALARVLARDLESEPLPLILDDTMGWTDDGRFLQMTRILRDAAREFQLIVLTCHPGRFARLQPGRTIELDQLRRAAAPQE